MHTNLNIINVIVIAIKTIIITNIKQNLHCSSSWYGMANMICVKCIINTLHINITPKSTIY